MGDDFSDKSFVPASINEVVPTPNQSTRVFMLRDLKRHPRTTAELTALTRAPAEALFDYAQASAPGLAYALFDSNQRILTMQHIAAAKFCGGSVVFGRHSHADSPTEANNLALRHLVLTQRVAEPHVVEVRDLRSAAGTRTMSGGRIEAARIDAPLALDLGELFIVATQTPVAMDKRSFSDRVLSPAVAPLMLSSARVGLRLERFSRVSAPRRTFGFSFTEGVGGEKGVVLRLEEMVETTPTAEQLLRGFIIGRYSRCDWPAVSDGAPSGMSRVHAIVFASQGQVYIADTGSTNGVKHTKLGCVRHKQLELGDQFWLGKACRLTVVAPRETDSVLA